MTAPRFQDEKHEIARRLEGERPGPTPSFRGHLARRMEAGQRWLLSAPAQRRLALTTAVAGTILALAAILSVAGIGPLAS